MQGAVSLKRLTSLGLDACAPEQVLLFLNRTADPGVFAIVGYQGWARIEADVVQAASFNDLFQDYTSAQDLVAAVQQIAQEQQAQSLPRGLLFCRDRWSPLNVCPGDTFNPFQVLGLDSATNAMIHALLPGSGVSSDLEPGPQLSVLLGALDIEVTVQPLGVRPDDLISLTILPAQPLGDRDAFLFHYGPSTGIIQLPPYGGQFPAPPAFQQAMAPFLAPQ